MTFSGAFQLRTMRHEWRIGDDLEQGDHDLRLVVLRPVTCYPERQQCPGNAGNLLRDYTRCHNMADHNLNTSSLFQETIPALACGDRKRIKNLSRQPVTRAKFKLVTT
jgi:hypothetical protein